LKESVRNFIEKNILALEEEDIVLFLYLASIQLSKQDVNVLCDYLDTAKIEYKDYIPAVIEELVKDDVGLHYRRKVQLSTLVDDLPHFNYKDYTEFRNTVANAIRKVYPNKVILPDSYGIEYVMERI
jgi:hypothetical protein